MMVDPSPPVLFFSFFQTHTHFFVFFIFILYCFNFPFPPSSFSKTAAQAVCFLTTKKYSLYHIHMCRYVYLLSN